MEEYKYFQDYFHLDCDESGHWYVIKDSESEQFAKWVYDGDESVDFSDHRVNGHPNRIHFRYYHIE